MPNFKISVDVPHSRRSRFESIFFYGFFSIFPLAGLVVLVIAIRDLNQGGQQAWVGVGFACIWLLVCAFILGFMIRSNRQRADNNSNFAPLQARRPGQTEERIRGSTATNSLTSNVVGLAFGGAGLTCLIASLRNATMEGRNIGIGMGTVFLMLGLLFLIAEFSAIAYRRKFGIASIRVTRPAAHIGSRLAGMLEVPKGIRHDDRFKFRLTCTRITRTHQRGANRQDSVSRESLWIGEEILRPTSSRPDGSMELPFTFTIPAGLPGSFKDYPRIEW